jgi:hypothetical protein
LGWVSHNTQDAKPLSTGFRHLFSEVIITLFIVPLGNVYFFPYAFKTFYFSFVWRTGHTGVVSFVFAPFQIKRASFICDLTY